MIIHQPKLIKLQYHPHPAQLALTMISCDITTWISEFGKLS